MHSFGTIEGGLDWEVEGLGNYSKRYWPRLILYPTLCHGC